METLWHYLTLPLCYPDVSLVAWNPEWQVGQDIAENSIFNFGKHTDENLV